VKWPKEGNIKEDGTSHATRRRPLPLSELKHRLHEVNAQLAVLEDIQLVRFASPRIGASMRVLHRLLHTMLHTMLKIGTRQTKRSED
jgi:hypothetical protein